MWNTVGSSLDPRMMQSAQQMMAQKLMDTGPAPTANSSDQSAAANVMAQAGKGAMMPSMMDAMRTGQAQTPDWMKWIGNQFSGGAAPTTGMGVGAGVGGLY
jgi:hypothetical protein